MSARGSGSIRVSAMPTMSAVKMTASMSFSTSALSGLAGHDVHERVDRRTPSSCRLASFFPASLAVLRHELVAFFSGRTGRRA